MALDTWTFAAGFSVGPAIFEKQQVVLVLNGIDTIADISVNGKKVAAVDNYHRWVKGSSTKPNRRAGQRLLPPLLPVLRGNPAWPSNLSLRMAFLTSTLRFIGALPHCREWYVPVKDVLLPGANNISITIQPAIPYVINAKKSYPYHIPTVTVRQGSQHGPRSRPVPKHHVCISSCVVCNTVHGSCFKTSACSLLCMSSFCVLCVCILAATGQH